jgi:hypothetical protein
MNNTKKETIEEMIKCGKNPQYFLNKYGYVVHLVRGLIKFDTYPYQNDILKACCEHRYNIALKSRQLGMTTVIARFHSVAFIIYATSKYIGPCNQTKECSNYTSHG